MEAGIPVLPVYNGDNTALDDVKAIINGTVPGLERDSEHWPLVKYVFKEQILELVSTQHATDVAARKRDVAARVKALPARKSEEAASGLSPERQLALLMERRPMSRVGRKLQEKRLSSRPLLTPPTMAALEAQAQPLSSLAPCCCAAPSSPSGGPSSYSPS